ncbi:hypothetical protein Lal_00010213 [Lupinus albus]|uniref:Putative centromere protein C/Mif2/cnp3 n=1 Tax=Lupinus albus TaxID=3870 RepID=A0A6A4NGR2_LUPAL|nr:putative centromere protein C/Mif2/cnp3 [Lupinus albus]KAF1859629.1 hypothetical protein Lal_00010213 [Lupinus albus]
MEDPLFNYYGLSLFPQLTSISPSIIPYDSHHDLHQIHNHLKPMALANPSMLLDEAKSILDANSELFNSQTSSVLPSNETDDVVPEESQDQEFPRRRRPALGLKRGHFSSKPTKNPPVENLLPALDLDKLKDPVEFFLAHERLENAKREIQKQMGGVSFESNENNTSNKPRQRRPELPGNNQRRGRYRHRYPKETLDNNEYVPSSQEIIGSISLSPVGENTGKGGSDILDPVGENTDEGGDCLTSLENKVTDLSAKEDDKLNDLLDGLLRCSPEDLEGDGAMTLLQERLQITPIVLEELSVPDFPDNKMIDLKSLQGNLSKPRKALSNIDNLLKGMNKTPLKQGVGYPVQQLASPTPPRSPFAALSSLQKHISRSKPSVDPFSAVEIDQLSTRNYSPAPMINQELNLVGSGNPSNEQNEHIIGDVIAVSKPSSDVNTVSNQTETSEESKKDNSAKSPDISNVPLPEETIAASETTLVDDTSMNFSSTSQNSMEDNAGEPGLDANADSNECHVDMDVDVGGIVMCEGAMNDKEDRPNFEGIIQAPAASVPMADLDFNLVNPQDQSSPAGFQASAKDKCTKKADDVPEKCLQEKPDNSLVPVNGQRKAKLRSQKQRQSESNKLSRRQSLAAAGTSWKSGLRRSTRNRTRPLEYWKGERMVYGRIHDSLTTVIGVKCMSPGTDGKPTMKVKSYVSDKYKELLELASLH